MAHLIRGFYRYASPGRSGIIYPGQWRSMWSDSAERMEGFARSFFLAAPYLLHNPGGVFTFESDSFDLGEFYRRGIVSGTDRSSDEYWGGIKSFSQTIVEAASLALNLYLARTSVWDAFSPDEQRQVASYLLAVGRCKTYRNNWMLFRAIIHAVLKRFEMPYDESAMRRLIKRSAALYVGDGWYSDGRERCFDYYNAWVMHPYLLFWCDINPDTEPGFFGLCRERTRIFTDHYRHFFAPDGSFPAYGRSLIYRSAVVSVFPVAEYYSCSALQPGEARRICSGNVKYFWDKGAVDKQGFLTLGFHRPLPELSEYYSGTQSPLWANKAWWTFLLPPSHRFWTDQEVPLPVETGSFTRSLVGPGLIVSGEANSQQVIVAAPNANTYIEKKYSNLYWSSHFGFTVSRRGADWAFDNAVCAKNGDGSLDLVRGRCSLIRVGDGFLTYSARLGDTWPARIVYTSLIFKGNTVVRIHTVDFGKAGRFFEGGLSIDYEDEGYETVLEDNSVRISAGARSIVFRRLYGWDDPPDYTEWNHGEYGNNIYGRHAVYPHLSTSHAFRGRKTFASACTGVVDGQDNLLDESVLQSFDVDDDVVDMQFQDGERVLVQPTELKRLEGTIEGVAGHVRFARITGSDEPYVVYEKPGSVRLPPTSLPSALYDRLFFRVLTAITQRKPKR